MGILSDYKAWYRRANTKQRKFSRYWIFLILSKLIIVLLFVLFVVIWYKKIK